MRALLQTLTPDPSPAKPGEGGTSSRAVGVAWFFFFALSSSLWCVTTARTIGATFDEPTYLENGMQFWRTGSHRTLMRLGTMPLPMDVQTLPLAVAERIRGNHWDLDADFQHLLPWMRHGNLVFWWLLLLYGYRTGVALAGDWGGRLAVAVLACEPNLLAHAALATTDIAITATVLALAYHFQRNRGESWRWRVVLPGVWYGIALLSKASALVFGPLCLLVIATLHHTNDPHSRDRKGAMLAFLRDAIGIGVIGFAVALLGCGCDFQPDESFVRWANGLPNGTPRTLIVWLAEHLRIFGNAGECLVMQIRHNLRGHGQYLLGESSKQPFWYYFPVVFAIKLTVPMLLGLGLVAILRPWIVAKNWILACALTLFAFSFTCRVQIGIRLQLASVAFLAIGLAVAIAPFLSRRPVRWATFAGVGWMAFASGQVWPHGLCYVNELWGGRDRGPALVSDSNYDWGQGLPELAAWNRDRGGLPLDVWYFGRDPLLKHLPVRDLPLHCVPLTQAEDMKTYCWGRYLAVGASVRHGYPVSDSHRRALEFLQTREPTARTATFLIYDLTDIPPPQQATAPAKRVGS